MLKFCFIKIFIYQGLSYSELHPNKFPHIKQFSQWDSVRSFILLWIQKYCRCKEYIVILIAIFSRQVDNLSRVNCFISCSGLRNTLHALLLHCLLFYLYLRIVVYGYGPLHLHFMDFMVCSREVKWLYASYLKKKHEKAMHWKNNTSIN